MADIDEEQGLRRGQVSTVSGDGDIVNMARQAASLPWMPQTPKMSATPSSAGNAQTDEERHNMLEEIMEKKDDEPSIFSPALHRRNFADRLYMESKLEMYCCRFVLYAGMLLLFCLTLNEYEDVYLIADAHEQIQNRYVLNKVIENKYKTPTEIMAFFHAFIETTYTMSSAMVDVNAMDNIDLNRCLNNGDDTPDICNIMYWRLPLRDPSAKDYLNMTNLRADNGEYGLHPEHPIILRNWEDFPYMQVVPLSALAFQTRAKEVPCAGFGQFYNDHILKAGVCEAGVPCEVSESMPSRFQNTNQHPKTGKKQEVYVAYQQKAFSCVDRSVPAEDFMDTGWSPWATRSELQSGKSLKVGKLGAQVGFYKFVPSVAYLQAPILDSILMPDHRNYSRAAPPCQPCGALDPGCTDPLEFEDHPMWSESYDAYEPGKCSWRKTWTTTYLSKGLSDRKNSFFDVGTSEASIAIIVLTPSGDGLADLVTLLKVTFRTSQGGRVKGEFTMVSIVELDTMYYNYAVVTMSWASLVFLTQLRYFYADWQRAKDLKKFWRNFKIPHAVDMVLATAVFMYLLINVVYESSLSFDTTMMDAFNADDEEKYFDLFSKMFQLNTDHNNFKTSAYFIVIAQMFQLNFYLGLHPRMSALVRTLENSADSIFHFMLYASIILTNLAFLGYWQFGPYDLQYGSMFRSGMNLIGTFMGGGIETPDRVSKVVYNLYFVFIFMYAMLFIFIFLNIFIAIIVDADSMVKEELKQYEAENDVLTDFYDIAVTFVKARMCKWPQQQQVCLYLLQRGGGTDADVEELPGVTAEELYHNLHDHEGDPMFCDMAEAERYVIFYMRKVYEQGRYLLQESRMDKLYEKGEYFKPTETQDEVINPGGDVLSWALKATKSNAVLAKWKGKDTGMTIFARSATAKLRDPASSPSQSPEPPERIPEPQGGSSPKSADVEPEPNASGGSKWRLAQRRFSKPKEGNGEPQAVRRSPAKPAPPSQQHECVLSRPKRAPTAASAPSERKALFRHDRHDELQLSSSAASPGETATAIAAEVSAVLRSELRREMATLRTEVLRQVASALGVAVTESTANPPEDASRQESKGICMPLPDPRPLRGLSTELQVQHAQLEAMLESLGGLVERVRTYANPKSAAIAPLQPPPSASVAFTPPGSPELCQWQPGPEVPDDRGSGSIPGESLLIAVSPGSVSLPHPPDPLAGGADPAAAAKARIGGGAAAEAGPEPPDTGSSRQHDTSLPGSVT